MQLPSNLGGRLQLGTASIVPIAVFGSVIAVLMAAFFIRSVFMSRRPVRVTDTWDCGQPLTARMEYTATGFAAPIRFFFRSILLSRKTLIVEPVVPGNVWIARRRLEWSMTSIWEKWFYMPITSAVLKVSSAIKRLQNGVIQFYILLILLTLVIVLVFAV